MLGWFQVADHVILSLKPTLLDPSTGLAVSELDDVVFATAERGTFYLADTGNNRVLRIEVEDMDAGSLWAAIGNLQELATVDTETGLVNGASD